MPMLFYILSRIPYGNLSVPRCNKYVCNIAIIQTYCFRHFIYIVNMFVLPDSTLVDFQFDASYLSKVFNIVRLFRSSRFWLSVDYTLSVQLIYDQHSKSINKSIIDYDKTNLSSSVHDFKDFNLLTWFINMCSTICKLLGF